MIPYYYTTILPERPLEPPENWQDEDHYEEEYDRAEDEMNGIFNRSQAASRY